MITVYGLRISYFTGKLESYLRYKEIPYKFSELTLAEFEKLLPEKTGAMQMPAVELEDGRWMTDSTPIIDWFEGQHPENSVLPSNPVQAFVCKLIEDYADEWQWRPAMHFRWSYPESSRVLSRELAETMGRETKAPTWLLRRRIEKRQHTNFVVNDGVNDVTWDHVEQSYYRLLGFVREVVKTRPFIFGELPTLADISLMGPLFRHYAMDPKPAVIMREDWPDVMEWVYRVWNARASKMNGVLIDGIPPDVAHFLTEIAQTHLEALCANAKARMGGLKKHDPVIQGVQYRNVPTSLYRMWCLEELQLHRASLEAKSLSQLDSLLKTQGALEPLLRLDGLSSGYNTDGNAPFGRSAPVYETIV